MSDYIGFFVRDQLGQVPNTTGTAWSSSPDIIFAGNQAPTSLSGYTSAAGYATDFGSTVYVGNPPTPNYVYLRALNTNPGATPSAPFTGRAWFFWVESDLALWPQSWRGDLITVAGNGINYQDITATANQEVVVTSLPYIWEPPAPNSGTHYCGISWIENTPVNPPQNPVANFGYMGTFDDLVNFVLDNPNMGWRNTNDVSGLGLTWTQTTNITGPSIQGQFNVGIQCSNMPTDGQVGFTVPPPGPVGSGVNFPLAPIPNPDYQGTVKITDWPGGAVSSITVNYKQGATVPPKGSSITVTLTTPTTSVSDATMERIMREQPNMLITHDLIEHDPISHEIIMITPTQVVLVGTQSYYY